MTSGLNNGISNRKRGLIILLHAVVSNSPMFAYEWDNGEPLSARGDENSASTTERTPHTLLRPVFINAVEVGYAYSQCDKDRRLNVRGVTIALWYFISRGHQALALLPYCFKSYADKSSSWSELMALFKMNLVEFTPGFGSDKYTEVNRILATRASEVGGCIVARSQMHSIVEERPTLNGTVERRLLMPSFNGNDIIFPVDGPLGRGGPTLQATLECDTKDPEWGRCSHHQLSLQDQRIWLQRLALLVPEQISWSALLTSVLAFSPSTPLPPINLPTRPPLVSHPKIQPPETNPIDGKGYSYTRAALRRANPDFCGPASFRDGMTNRDETDMADRSDPFRPEYLKTGNENAKAVPRFEEAAPVLPNFLGNPGSIYRIRPPGERSLEDSQKKTSDTREVAVTPSSPKRTPQQERLSKLAVIFGWEKASIVINKYPRVHHIAQLVELALNLSDSELSAHDGPPSNYEASEPAVAYDLIDLSLPGDVNPFTCSNDATSSSSAPPPSLLD